MTSLIDFILNLFRDERAAQAFVVDPELALLDAGLSNVTSAQIQSVAATAVPSLALGNGDPVVGLQRAVSNHYGWEPQFAPSPTWAPTWAPETNTDLLSNNDTRLLSPETNIYNDQSVDLGFEVGDFTLGDKTTANGPGAVAIGGDNDGDIVSGDESVLGNANSVNNGNIHTGQGSNVNVGHENSTNQGNTAAGDDVLVNEDGTVITTTHGTTNTSQGNTDWTAVEGNQTTTNIDGVGNHSGVDNSQSVVTTNTTTTTVTDNSVQDWGHLPLAGDSSYDYDASQQYSSSYVASPQYTSSYNSSAQSTTQHESTSTYAPSYDASTHDNTTVDTHHNLDF